MASISTTPVYSSPLLEELCCASGGPLYARGFDLYEPDPDVRLKMDGAHLKHWLSFHSRTNKPMPSLEHLFKRALQVWSQETIKELKSEKKFFSEILGICSKGDRPKVSYDCLNFSQVPDYINPSVFKEDPEDADLILVDDGFDQKIAILKEWKQEPNRMFETVPRVKAAFDYLKNQQLDESCAFPKVLPR